MQKNPNRASRLGAVRRQEIEGMNELNGWQRATVENGVQQVY